MKPIIKYISLLLFSGLILPFYNSSTKTDRASVQPKPVAIHKSIPVDPVQSQYFIYKDIAGILFPETRN